MSSYSQKPPSETNASTPSPVTPGENACPSLHARRHRFLPKIVTTGSESEEGLQQIVGQHLGRFPDSDAVEFGAIEEMAVAYWRMRRAWAMEKEWMDQFIADHPTQRGITVVANAFGELAGSGKYRLLLDYESRMHHTYQRALKTLLILQTHAARRAKKAGRNNLKNCQTSPSFEENKEIKPQ